MDATPDGREGWLSYAVRNNYATFVPDRPGYGRSGFDSTVINEARATGNLNLLPNIAESTHLIWNTTGGEGFGHTIPRGSTILDGTMIRHGDPGDPDIPETDPPSEAHGTYPPAFPIPPVDMSIDASIAAREGAIGPAPNPVNNEYLALEAYKWVIPNMDNLFPGSTCDTCVPSAISPTNTWGALALAELVERLGGAILSPHSQSSDVVLHALRHLKANGNLDLVKGIIVPETTQSGTNTPNFTFERFGLTPQDFDHIPYMIANGDYRQTGIRINNRDFIDSLNASPTRSVGPAALFELDDPEFGDRFLGTTHIVQLGTNHIDLMDFMLEWAEDNIDNPIVAHACPGGQGVGKGKGKGPKS